MTFAKQADWPRVVVTHAVERTQPWVHRLADSLRSASVEVVPVAANSRAVERLGSLRPRVVVVDEVDLAGAGWSLLRQIRRADASLPCLMVVRAVEPDLLNRALQLSAYSVFEVPVNTELMGQMVCRLLARRA